MPRFLSLPLAASLLLSSAALPAHSAITWNITFADVTAGSGAGFDDPVNGAARRAVVDHVTSYLNSVLSATGSVDLEVETSLDNPGSSTLASAGPYAFTAPAGFTNGFVFDHATSGIDPTGGAPDASMVVNFGKSYYLGTGTPGGSEFDLYSVLLHEVSHSLGLLTFSINDGASSISGGAAGSPSVYTVFDSLLSAGPSAAAADRLIDTSFQFQQNSADLTSGNVYFQGAAAMAVWGGPVPIYAPSTYASGSSIGHVANEVSASVMLPGIAPGTAKRTYASVDLAMLQDIGWTLTAVPEPGTFAVLGVSGLVLSLRRRRTLAEG